MGKAKWNVTRPRSFAPFCILFLAHYTTESSKIVLGILSVSKIGKEIKKKKQKHIDSLLCPLYVLSAS